MGKRKNTKKTTRALEVIDEITRWFRVSAKLVRALNRLISGLLTLLSLVRRIIGRILSRFGQPAAMPVVPMQDRPAIHREDLWLIESLSRKAGVFHGQFRPHYLPTANPCS